MDTVLRSAAVYLFLLVVFRISGKRSLSQITTFDFILLLIISEATQQALVGNDFSFANAAVVIVSLVVLDNRVLVDGGALAGIRPRRRQPAGRRRRKRRLLEDRAKREGVTLTEILAQGREKHGLERLEQFKYAILERHGGISVVPRKTHADRIQRQDAGTPRRNRFSQNPASCVSALSMSSVSKFPFLLGDQPAPRASRTCSSTPS